MVDISLPTFYQNLLAVWIDKKDYIKMDERYKGNDNDIDCVQIESRSIFDETLFLTNIYIDSITFVMKMGS